MNLIIANTAIRTDAEGRYCLNDLHKAAGGEKRNQPSDWLSLQQTGGLIAEISNSGDSRRCDPTDSKAGRYGGTYVCKELVYAYAMWISPSFHLQVIRAYDAMMMNGLQSVESLSPAVAKQIGGVIKAVVHKQFEEALAQTLPALVHGEIAKHNLSVRYGCTSGQIWRKHGLPSEGMRGAANWLGNRLAERGCAVIDNGRAEMGGRLSRLFDPDRADVAMRGGLRSLCDRYVAERRGQKKLFVVTPINPDQGVQP